MQDPDSDSPAAVCRKVFFITIDLKFKIIFGTSMVRPRASGRNLSIAAEFGSMVVVRINSKELSMAHNTPIPCNGPRSLFALFAACFPHLSREPGDEPPKNRSGVSMVEMNKALRSTGFRYVCSLLSLLFANS